MANTKSAEKRIRRNQRFEEINRDRRSAMRTYIKKVRAAIEEKNLESAQKEYNVLKPYMMRCVTKNIIHKKTCSRTLSRLSNHIKALKEAT